MTDDERTLDDARTSAEPSASPAEVPPDDAPVQAEPDEDTPGMRDDQDPDGSGASGEGGAPASEQRDPVTDDATTVIEPVVLEEAARQSFSGPMRPVTFVVALGWLALAVYGFWQVSPPAGIVVGALSVLGAIGTAWLAYTMRVPWTPEGIELPGGRFASWTDVDGVSIRPGFLSMPQVEFTAGRAIEAVPLDTLAWFGSRGPVLRVAQKIADQAGVGDVAAPHRGVGKRADRMRRAARQA